MLGGYSKLGVMGESAGGYLAALMSAMHPKKIDFQIDCYPVISMDPGKTHTGSMTMFLGTAHETGGHHWGQWQDFPASMFEWIASLHAE